MGNTIIYHMLPAAQWQAQPPDHPYRHESLANEGFIHCTGDRGLLVQVANRFHHTMPDDFVILCIDVARVQSEIVWEEADGHTFPHLYGPLNLDAVVDVIPFPRDKQGAFQIPHK